MSVFVYDTVVLYAWICRLMYRACFHVSRSPEQDYDVDTVNSTLRHYCSCAYLHLHVSARGACRASTMHVQPQTERAAEKWLRTQGVRPSVPPSCQSGTDDHWSEEPRIRIYSVEWYKNMYRMARACCCEACAQKFALRRALMIGSGCAYVRTRTNGQQGAPRGQCREGVPLC